MDVHSDAMQPQNPTEELQNNTSAVRVYPRDLDLLRANSNNTLSSWVPPPDPFNVSPAERLAIFSNPDHQEKDLEEHFFRQIHEAISSDRMHVLRSWRFVRCYKLEGSEELCHEEEIGGSTGGNGWLTTHTWKVGREIAAGGFGCVHLHQNIDENRTTELRAVKSIYLKTLKKKEVDKVLPEINRFWARELETIFTFSKLETEKQLGMFIEASSWYTISTTLYIAMDYYELGNLDSFIEANINKGEMRISLNDCRSIIYQMTKGIGYIHSKEFVHRDFKLKVSTTVVSFDDKTRAHGVKNILIKSGPPNISIRITDFGLSKRGRDIERDPAVASLPVASLRGSSAHGSVKFMSPEKARHFTDGDWSYHDDFESDIWALGVSVFKVLTGNVPFPITNEDDSLKHILDKELCREHIKEGENKIQKFIVEHGSRTAPRHGSGAWQHRHLFRFLFDLLQPTVKRRLKGSDAAARMDFGWMKEWE